MITRRKFINRSFAFFALTASPINLKAKQIIRRYQLTAKKSNHHFNLAKVTNNLWLYNGQSPGPLIKAKKGEVLDIKFINNLDQPTTIHWHGIRNINEMDGVPYLTQDPVEPGEVFHYQFPVNDAGTFWYHAHTKAWEQVTRGLYGPLIVTEDKKKYNKQEILILADDWQLDDELQFVEESLGSLHDWSHAGRYGNRLSINGTFKPNIDVPKNGKARIRFLNTANARILNFKFNDEVEFEIISVDGSPCKPFETNNLVIGPGQRIDILVNDTSKLLNLQEVSNSKNIIAAKFKHSLDSSLDETLFLEEEPFYRKPSMKKAKILDIHMQGGAMGNLSNAEFNGEKRSLRDLALNESKLWALNGKIGNYKNKIGEFKKGETIVLRCFNDTRWPHTMHLHGHHFWVSSKEFSNLKFNLLRDTYLMQPGEKTDLVFVANNPGKWLFHCHMIEHHASGMIGYILIS